MPNHPMVVAFDIIGTVFSMEPMRPALVELGLPSLGLDLLYTTALRDTFALAATNTFAPFQSVLSACLDELICMQDLDISSERKQAVLDMMKTLPPHDDAKAAFQVLTDAGIRLFALSNGATGATKGLLAAAGMDGLVERVLSVEDVKLSKPRAEVYLYAAQAAGVSPEEMALVAAHPWDVHGSKLAGLMGAYVSRGRPYSPALQAPDVSGDTLLEVTRKLTLDRR